jgi:hypothetical protein
MQPHDFPLRLIENYVQKIFIIWNRVVVLLAWWNQEKLRWAGHVVRMGEMNNAHRNFVWKCEGKRAFVKRSVWEDNIKMDVIVSHGDVDQIYIA